MKARAQQRHGLTLVETLLVVATVAFTVTPLMKATVDSAAAGTVGA